MTGSFELQLRQFAEKAKENADVAVRKVVLEVGARLVARSPVDTGRFRSNWNYGLGSADLATTQDTKSTVVNGLGGIPVKAAGAIHFITNNLPYAWPLERGTSKQAPQGMVGLTVMEFSAIVDQAALEVRSGQGAGE